MKIVENLDLTNYNSYRTKSICSVGYFPENENDLLTFFQSKEHQSYIVLGNGNNTILSRAYYQELFIILNGYFDSIKVSGNVIEAEAGATILEVSKMALKHGLTGAEFLYDIPSSVGGAIVMNAGTKEGETKNILLKVRYLDLEDMLIKEKSNSEIGFDYRNSFFQKNKDKIVLKSWFQLEKGDPLKIEKIMKDSKERRWDKQPREFPNCGSVFKRPPGKFVGPMIDELGLKGFQIGGAQVSEKHSGFIVNKSNATGQDILDLIENIKTKVFDHYSINLEVEQRIIY
jgi:UDP-N-acetylmuramate dehydrogenase